ncbi:MAG: TlpA family protein disulfide reductase [Roseivirga sp.]|nr:TlpA family protein disulfide reductase [Roseivirga sp.]
MKKATFFLFILFCTPLLSQEQTSIIIKQQGYGKNHGLRLIFNGKIIEPETQEDILLELDTVLIEPLYAQVLQKNSRYTGFWIEPGFGEVTVFKKGFPGSTEVKGSKSHAVYKSVKFADIPEDRFENFLTHKDHPVAIDYLNGSFQFSGLTAEQLQQLYDAVDENNKPKLDNLRAHLVTRSIPTVKIDSDIYDFTGQDKEGKSYSTGDYRGKYLLIDFAATGCGPCWAGYPELIAETSKYDKLQVITFNEDDAIDTWQSIADKRNIELDWPVLWSGENKKEVFEIYKIQGWPNFFLISPEGKVLDQWMGSGGDHLKFTLNRLVK